MSIWRTPGGGGCVWCVLYGNGGCMEENNKLIAQSEEFFIDNNMMDADDPYSVLNLLPPGIRDALLHLPRNLISLPDEDLKKVANPDALLRMIRRSFWEEYATAIKFNRKMALKKIMNNGCTREYFYDNIVAIPEKLAFILRPPMNEADTVRSIMEVSLERVNDFLKLEPIRRIEKKRYDKDGRLVSCDIDEKIDTAYITAVQKISESAISRIHGSVIQRVAIHRDEGAPVQQATPVDELEYIEEALKNESSK